MLCSIEICISSLFSFVFPMEFYSALIFEQCDNSVMLLFHKKYLHKLLLEIVRISCNHDTQIYFGIGCYCHYC